MNHVLKLLMLINDLHAFELKPEESSNLYSISVYANSKCKSRSP